MKSPNSHAHSAIQRWEKIGYRR